MQLLLETSADNQHYYCDSLKACLVTTVTSSGPSQSTIKLVATNMIANGKLAGKARLGLSLPVLWKIRPVPSKAFDYLDSSFLFSICRREIGGLWLATCMVTASFNHLKQNPRHV